jgi:lysozyme family protein
MSFEQALEFTLQEEGGLANVHGDSGGTTNKGITQHLYDSWRASRKLAAQSVSLMSDDELRNIYEEEFWTPTNCAMLPRGLDLAMFDFAVNAGCHQAVITLQEVVGVATDGHLGPATLNALRNCSVANCIQKYIEKRKEYYRSLNKPRFEDGWMARADRVAATATTMLA